MIEFNLYNLFTEQHMCGRFESKPSIQSLVKDFKKHNQNLKVELNSSSKEISEKQEYKEHKSINIAPTNKIQSISYAVNNYNLFLTHWGIKFSSNSPLIFNSRIETIKEKKYWTTLFDRNRLLVPMSAFYEWKKDGTRKIPYRIFLPDQEIFYVPAVYHIDKEKNIFTSLITTAPNEFIKQIHHRMPVILRIKEGINYLIDDAETNLGKCISYTGKMEMERVSL